MHNLIFPRCFRVPLSSNGISLFSQPTTTLPLSSDDEGDFLKNYSNEKHNICETCVWEPILVIRNFGHGPIFIITIFSSEQPILHLFSNFAKAPIIFLPLFNFLIQYVLNPLAVDPMCVTLDPQFVYILLLVVFYCFPFPNFIIISF